MNSLRQREQVVKLQLNLEESRTWFGWSEKLIQFIWSKTVFILMAWILDLTSRNENQIPTVSPVKLSAPHEN